MARLGDAPDAPDAPESSHPKTQRQSLLNETERIKLWDYTVKDIRGWEDEKLDKGLKFLQQIAGEYDLMLQETINLNNEIEQKCEEHRQNLESMEQHYDQESTKLKGIIGYLETHRPERATTKTKTMSLPDPPMYSGEKLSKVDLDDWVDKIRMKLLVNSDHYDTPLTEIGYIQNRICGKAAKQTAAGFKQGTVHTFLTADQALAAIIKACEEPLKKENAIATFRSLTQGKKTFQNFLLEFQELADVVNLPKELLLSDLRAKVNDDIGDHLVGYETDDFDELALKCAKIELHMKARTTRTKTTAPNSRWTSKTMTNFPDKETPDTTKVGKPWTPRTPGTISPRLPNMDPEKERMMKEGRCFGCGEFGHTARECPNRNMVKKEKVALITQGLGEDADVDTSDTQSLN